MSRRRSGTRGSRSSSGLPWNQAPYRRKLIEAGVVRIEIFGAFLLHACDDHGIAEARVGGSVELQGALKNTFVVNLKAGGTKERRENRGYVGAIRPIEPCGMQNVDDIGDDGVGGADRKLAPLNAPEKNRNVFLLTPIIPGYVSDDNVGVDVGV